MPLRGLAHRDRRYLPHQRRTQVRPRPSHAQQPYQQSPEHDDMARMKLAL
jgi:hypothetical protein